MALTVRHIAMVRRTLLLVSGLALLSWALTGHAQVIIDDIVDTSLSRYDLRFQYVGAKLHGLLLNTFYLLALIEFSWGMIKCYVDDASLDGFVKEIVTRTLFIGFFAWLFNRGATTANEIIDSFAALATASGTGIVDGALSPGTIFDQGQEVFARIYSVAKDIGVFEIVFSDDVSISDPIMLIFIGMAILVAMVILAAHFGVTLLETFIAANAGIVLLALGASRWTHTYAVSYLRYAMSVGMKLFILSIIVGLTVDEINRVLTDTKLDNVNNLFALLAFLSFSAVVAIIAPRSVRGMMDGVSVASGAAIGTAVGMPIRGTRTVSKTTGQISKLIVPKPGV